MQLGQYAETQHQWSFCYSIYNTLMENLYQKSPLKASSLLLPTSPLLTPSSLIHSPSSVSLSPSSFRSSFNDSESDSESEEDADGVARQHHILNCLFLFDPLSVAISWSSLAYHLLQNMSQCVRVLGFTDLRIEHISLLLCCYCNYLKSENEMVVNQLLGELLDISAGIEDYHVISSSFT